MAQKTSLPTDIVLGARQQYLSRLHSVLGGNPPVPYMQKPISQQSYDAQIQGMNEQSMMQLAQTDPKAAQKAAQRIAKLSSQPQSAPLPAQDEFDPLK